MSRSALDQLAPGSTSTLLIALLRDGAIDAWSAFRRLYQPLVLHWCRKCGLTQQDAEDVYQEACISVRKSINGFRLLEQTDTFRGWLWTIVRRRVADFNRRSARHIHAPGGDANDLFDLLPERPPEDPSERMKWLVRGIEEARGRVSPRVFAYFELTFRDSWTADQITEQFGVSHHAVLKGVARFLTLLRGILGETLPDDLTSDPDDAASDE